MWTKGCGSSIGRLRTSRRAPWTHRRSSDSRAGRWETDEGEPDDGDATWAGSAGERRVARTLLETYPTAGLKSLPRLAEGAGVTGPTVLRFVRKIGFDGYPDFQRSLRDEVQARSEGLHSLYETKGPTQVDDVFRRSREAFTRAMDATLASSSLEKDLEDVVALLSDRKRRVWFVGGRFSQLVATYLYLQLRMLRPGCLMVAEAPERRVLDSLDISRRDVLCLFDYRRYQQDTVEAGKRAA